MNHLYEINSDYIVKRKINILNYMFKEIGFGGENTIATSTFEELNIIFKEMKMSYKKILLTLATLAQNLSIDNDIIKIIDDLDNEKRYELLSVTEKLLYEELRISMKLVIGSLNEGLKIYLFASEFVNMIEKSNI